MSKNGNATRNRTRSVAVVQKTGGPKARLAPVSERGQAFQAWLDDHGLSKRELSRRTGLNQATVTRAIVGDPQKQSMGTISALLGAGIPRPLLGLPD